MKLSELHGGVIEEGVGSVLMGIGRAMGRGAKRAIRGNLVAGRLFKAAMLASNNDITRATQMITDQLERDLLRTRDTSKKKIIQKSLNTNKEFGQLINTLETPEQEKISTILNDTRNGLDGYISTVYRIIRGTKRLNTH